MNNGTDRDIALDIAGLMSDINTLIGTINDNLYVPHILEQPVDSTTAVGQVATFSIVADNVKGYQWQYKVSEESIQWLFLGGESTGSTFSINALEARYDWRIRCAVTGLNGTIIYSDTVKIVLPE